MLSAPAAMLALINRQRVIRLTSFAGVQLVVQGLGFLAGIVLVRWMEPVQYGYYTLAVSLMGVAAVLADLGVSAAVLAVGGAVEETIAGRPAAGPTERGQLLAQARALQNCLLAVAAAVAAPAAMFLLLRQGAAPWQAFSLALLICGTATLQVRAAAALSVLRLLGHVGLQQRLDLALNVAKLLLFMALGTLFLNALAACFVNLLAAVAACVVLRLHMATRAPPPAVLQTQHRPALLAFVRAQAPNSLYYLVSSQVAVWLVGIFGSAERVAEVGELGRLGALFALVAAVSAALVQPYFARRRSVAEWRAGLFSVNAFFALLLLTLLAVAAAVPQALLWVLGGHYGGLQQELPWMLAAATLSAWGGTLYSVGCARSWVLPFWLAAPVGALVTVWAALTVDLATTRGSFMLNTAVAGAGLLVALGHLMWRLRQPTEPTTT